MNLLENVEKALQTFHHPKTSDYRKIATKLHKAYQSIPKETLFNECENLLKTNKTPHTIIAYDLVFKRRSTFESNDFNQFEHWVKTYLKDWWDVDDFGTHALGYHLMVYPENFTKINQWTTHQNFPVRRMAAVVLIYAIRKNTLSTLKPFDIAKNLLEDEHYLVQKGYGWMLKELSVHHPNDVINFLHTHINHMPRTAFRYALEKLPKETKQKMMKR